MRWIIRAIKALVLGGVALGIILGAALFLVPNDQVARLLESQLEAATGRDVTFQGTIRPSVYPVLGVQTGPVRIANASWSDGGPILQADSLNVAVDLVGLLSGDLLIGDITAVSPRLLLETAADGSVNWDVFSGDENDISASGGSDAKEPASGPALRRISLENLSLSDAAIRFVDRQTGGNVEIENLDLTLHAPDLDGATTFDIAYSRAGTPIVLKGTVARTQDLLDGAASPVRAVLTAAGAELTFDGDAQSSGAARGQVQIAMPETDAFLAALGLPKLDLPRGFGAGGNIKAHLALSPGGQAQLSDLRADLDGTQISGDIAVDVTGTRPRVAGTLVTSALDLTAFSGPGGASGPVSENTQARSSGWSKARIDASALGLLDADLKVTLPKLVFDRIALTDVAAHLTIDRARAVLDVARAKGFGGKMSGTFVANNRNGFSTRLTARAENVDMRQLMSDFAEYDRLAGTGTASINVLGIGPSVDALMHSLDGEASLDVRNGEIFGFALAELFLNQGADGGSTIFDHLAATFQISKGVAENRDLTLILPSAQATGSGKIDLGAQRIDYRITPRLSREDGRALIFPVTLKGAWADPKIRPDLEAAVQQTFEAEIAEEKEKARRKANDAIAQELGVTVNEDEDLGQAIERTLQEEIDRELEKGLKKLFGGN